MQSVKRGSDPPKTHLPAPVLQDEAGWTIRKQNAVRWSSSRSPRSVSGHWLLASGFQLPFRGKPDDGSSAYQPRDQLGCPSSFVLLFGSPDVLCSSDNITWKKAKHQLERSPRRFGILKNTTNKIDKNGFGDPFSLSLSMSLPLLCCADGCLKGCLALLQYSSQ